MHKEAREGADQLYVRSDCEGWDPSPWRRETLKGLLESHQNRSRVERWVGDCLLIVSSCRKTRNYEMERK